MAPSQVSHGKPAPGLSHALSSLNIFDTQDVEPNTHLLWFNPGLQLDAGRVDMPSSPLYPAALLGDDMEAGTVDEKESIGTELKELIKLQQDAMQMVDSLIVKIKKRIGRIQN
jgi:hypothetical protein